MSSESVELWPLEMFLLSSVGADVSLSIADSGILDGGVRDAPGAVSILLSLEDQMSG